MYHARFERVQADWALIESAPLMAQVTVNDADAEAYLKSHEAQFTRPERRRIQYVLIAPKSFALAVTDADAEAYYKEHRSEFERPQRLKASHILVRVPPPEAARRRTSPRPRSRRRFVAPRLARTSARSPGSCPRTPPPRPRG